VPSDPAERQHPSRTLLILVIAGLAYALAQTTVVLASSAVAGVAVDAGFTDAFLISAAVALGSALVAVCIPRVAADAHDRPLSAVEMAGA
jgi:hypothetical protein